MAKIFGTALDMAKLEVLNLRLHHLSTAPGTPVTGMVYYDTDDNIPLFWNGTDWISMSAASATIDWGEDADLANVTKAAESAGVLNEAARADHKHDVDTAAPATVGTANTEGSAASLARSDHVHNTRSHDHSNAADGTSLSPATFVAPLNATPAQTANGSVVWDSDGFFLTVGDGSGRRTFYAVIDATSDPVAVDGAAAGDGTETTVARKDHKHSATMGSVTAQTSFGASSNNGSATSFSRSDHVHGTPTHDDAAHNTVELNDLAAADGNYSMGGNLLTNLGAPSAGTDAANKDYVDGVAQGLDVKQSVRVATTVAGTLATSFENGDAIDGVTLATNDRILIKNQASAQENGIYVVAASGAPTRALDANSWSELISAFVFVEEGTANADTGWVSTVNAGGTLNTTAVNFAQFSGAGAFTAGNGLTQSGTTFNVGAGTGIVANTDDVAVLRTDASGRVPLLYTALYGDNSATSFNIDHNLNTLAVQVTVIRVSDGVEVEVDVSHTTVNRVVLAHAVAPASNAFRVIVHG